MVFLTFGVFEDGGIVGLRTFRLEPWSPAEVVARGCWLAVASLSVVVPMTLKLSEGWSAKRRCTAVSHWEVMVVSLWKAAS